MIKTFLGMWLVVFSVSAWGAVDMTCEAGTADKVAGTFDWNGDGATFDAELEGRSIRFAVSLDRGDESLPKYRMTISQKNGDDYRLLVKNQGRVDTAHGYLLAQWGGPSDYGQMLMLRCRNKKPQGVPVEVEPRRALCRLILEADGKSFAKNFSWSQDTFLQDVRFLDARYRLTASHSWNTDGFNVSAIAIGYFKGKERGYLARNYGFSFPTKQGSIEWFTDEAKAGHPTRVSLSCE